MDDILYMYGVHIDRLCEYYEKKKLCEWETHTPSTFCVRAVACFYFVFEIAVFFIVVFYTKVCLPSLSFVANRQSALRLKACLEGFAVYDEKKIIFFCFCFHGNIIEFTQNIDASGKWLIKCLSKEKLKRKDEHLH